MIKTEVGAQFLSAFNKVLAPGDQEVWDEAPASYGNIVNVNSILSDGKPVVPRGKVMAVTERLDADLGTYELLVSGTDVALQGLVEVKRLFGERKMCQAITPEGVAAYATRQQISLYIRNPRDPAKPTFSRALTLNPVEGLVDTRTTNAAGQIHRVQAPWEGVAKLLDRASSIGLEAAFVHDSLQPGIWQPFPLDKPNYNSTENAEQLAALANHMQLVASNGFSLIAPDS